MNLHWDKLSFMQDQLDGYIAAEKGIKHADCLKEKAIALCVELGEMLNERKFIFKYWSNKTGDRQKALTEYVDVLHFLLSYGNAIGFDFAEYEINPEVRDQRDLILGLFAMFASMEYTEQFEDALSYFLMLAKKLNFTRDEIEYEYILKHSENHRRQEVGY